MSKLKGVKGTAESTISKAKATVTRANEAEAQVKGRHAAAAKSEKEWSQSAREVLKVAHAATQAHLLALAKTVRDAAPAAAASEAYDRHDGAVVALFQLSELAPITSSAVLLEQAAKLFQHVRKERRRLLRLRRHHKLHAVAASHAVEAQQLASKAKELRRKAQAYRAVQAKARRANSGRMKELALRLGGFERGSVDSFPATQKNDRGGAKKARYDTRERGAAGVVAATATAAAAAAAARVARATPGSHGDAAQGGNNDLQNSMHALAAKHTAEANQLAAQARALQAEAAKYRARARAHTAQQAADARTVEGQRAPGDVLGVAAPLDSFTRRAFDAMPLEGLPPTLSTTGNAFALHSNVAYRR